MKLTDKQWKQIVKGSLVLILIFGLVLLSCYGIASSTNDTARKVFYIVFFSLVGALYVAYWIYMVLYFRKKNKKEEEEEENKYQGGKNKKDGGK